jgi:hypothetical protein
MRRVDRLDQLRLHAFLLTMVSGICPVRIWSSGKHEILVCNMEISSRNENGPHAKPGRGPPGVAGAGELGAEGDEGQKGGGAEGGGGDR